MRVKDLSKVQYRRIVGLIYGKPKVGKTTAALKLAKEGFKLCYFSFDMGVRKALKSLEKKGKDSPFYDNFVLFVPGVDEEGKRTKLVISSTLDDLEEARKIASKWGFDKTWLVIDTITHLQVRALSDARKVMIGRQSTSVSDEPVRDAVTQVDYNVNLGQMRELADHIITVPWNVLYIANESQQRDRQDKPVYGPAIMGQSYNAIVGDVDFCFRMVVIDGKRFFKCQPSPVEEAGYRDGKFEELEEANLNDVWKKFME